MPVSRRPLASTAPAAPSRPQGLAPEGLAPARAAGWLVLLAALLVPLAAAASPLAQARQWVEWGDWIQARSLLDAALKSTPNDPKLLAYDAHVLLAFQENKQAVKLARQAVKLDARCGSCHLFLAEGLGQQAKGVSRFRALFKLHHILKHLKLALQLSPNDPDVYWGFINYYLQVPPAAGGGAAKAYAYVRQLAQYDAVDGALAMGEVEVAGGHPERAMQVYRQSAAAHPNDPRALFAVGEALFRQGDFAAALDWLQRARRLAPQSAFYTGYEAAALVHLSRQIQAWRLIRAYETRPQRSQLPEFLVAQALKAVGQNFPWARQLLESYLAVPHEPNQPSHRVARSLLASLG